MLAPALVGFYARTSNVTEWCYIERRYQVLERGVAEGVRTWALLLAPSEIAPGHITKERRLFSAPLLTILCHAIAFRLHSDFAPLVDHARQALGADLLLVLMAIGAGPANPPSRTALTLEETSIFSAFSCHILSLVARGQCL